MTPEELAGLIAEASGWVEGTALSDDANRKIWLLNKLADALTALSRELEEARARWDRSVEPGPGGDRQETTVEAGK